MAKKDKNPLEEYLKLKNEMIRDKVDEIFRNDPKNWRTGLEEMGFQYYDDGDDQEELEERQARAENKAQRNLVAFFEGQEDPSDSILDLFIAERRREDPNLALLRKYFRAANQRLKALILYGLEHRSDSLELLSDLGYFHEFENNLRLVISHYTQACMNQTDLQLFSELAQDFYDVTAPDGYDAFYALRDLFEPQTEKRKIIDFLISEAEADEEAIIKF
jgi:hypothetical protein